MVVVSIEIWPHGDQSQSRPIGKIQITNDGSGTRAKGSYWVSVAHGGKYINKKGTWKRGRLTNHPRSLSPYHLVVRALMACGIF